MKKRSLVLIIATCLVVFASWQLFSNRQYLKDLYIVSTTDLSLASMNLGVDISLTDKADFIYQASQSELKKAESFRASCSGLEKNNIVLGCYKAQRIYIYDVDDKKLNGVKQVTAAHELLHAVYERLPEDERGKINSLLLKQSKTISDTRIKETLSLYQDVSQEDFYNEMHSIFGAEVRKLIPELEQHYTKYFSSRKKVVDYAQKYQAVFNELENQRQSYDDQLGVLKTEIDNLQSSVNSKRVELDQLRSEMDSLRTSGNLTAYNQRVPQYNQLVASYNSNVNSLKSKVQTYNDIVAKRNTIVTTENNLAQELDSSAEVRTE